MTQSPPMRPDFMPFASRPQRLGELSGAAPCETGMVIEQAFRHGGEAFVATCTGALYWPRMDMLVVADLHLEKGSAFARRGQFLPPYDSQATLQLLARDIDHFKPAKVVCLGDSFHDVDGPARLAPEPRALLDSLMAAQDWLWIIGNHDPVLPEALGGERSHCLTLAGEVGAIRLCHEPGASSEREEALLDVGLELSGHLHPAATIRGRGRAMRRKCFVLSTRHLILPSYGSFTGGLDVSDEAFAPFVEADTELLVIGRTTLARHPLPTARRRR